MCELPASIWLNKFMFKLEFEMRPGTAALTVGLSCFVPVKPPYLEGSGV